MSRSHIDPVHPAAWLGGSHRCGIGVHWTAQVMPCHGPALPFAQAVARFDVDRFVGEVADAGVRHVLFTICHAQQFSPCPSATLDRILPGRTHRRDLVGEMAQRLANAGIAFIAYYNHSCNHADDPEWERAVGYHDRRERFVENYCAIVAEWGRRYGSLLRGWWFDSAPSLDVSGPTKTATTAWAGEPFPWRELATAAKAGDARRIHAFNPGFDDPYFLYTQQQDYLAGEIFDAVDHPPAHPVARNGLPYHAWICLDWGGWVHTQPDTPLKDIQYPWESLARFARQCRRIGAAVTWNLDIDQAGRMSPQSLATVRRMNELSC